MHRDTVHTWLAVSCEPDPECSFRGLAHPLDATGRRVRSSP